MKLAANLAIRARVLTLDEIYQPGVRFTFIQIDDEILAVDRGEGTTALRVDRGALGTAKAAHLADADVVGLLAASPGGGAESFPLFIDLAEPPPDTFPAYISLGGEVPGLTNAALDGVCTMADEVSGVFVGSIDATFNGVNGNHAFNIYVAWYYALQKALDAHFGEVGWTVEHQGGVAPCIIGNGGPALINTGQLTEIGGGGVTGPVTNGYFIRGPIVARFTFVS